MNLREALAAGVDLPTLFDWLRGVCELVTAGRYNSLIPLKLDPFVGVIGFLPVSLVMTLQRWRGVRDVNYACSVLIDRHLFVHINAQMCLGSQ